MKILSVVGARPQFVKLSAIARAIAAVDGVEHVIVHTGQHYDHGMSEVFFEDLGIPSPDVNLGVGSGTHGAQTGAMMSALDPILALQKPDWVLVYGDTNSTVAAALVAVKLRLPLAHLEAGLRSFNRAMPEEHNRVLTDHASDLLLAPSEVAMANLHSEGLSQRSVQIGDVMTDVCLQTEERVRNRPLGPLEGVDWNIPYVLATIHRAENTDKPERLRAIAAALGNLEVPVLLIAHPRLLAKAAEFDVNFAKGLVHVLHPLGYPQMIRAIAGSAGVVTDSGGLQKEAFLLRRPCTTIRYETEWVETLVDDWNILDPQLHHLPDLAVRAAPALTPGMPYGDGRAAARVVGKLRAITDAVSPTGCQT